MINLRIVNPSRGFLIVERTGGRQPSIKPGDVVKAEVVEVLSSGMVTLRIKGGFITARSEVPLEAGFLGLFKVSEGKGEVSTLRLQFMGRAEEKTGSSSPGLKWVFISRLVRELAGSLTKKGSDVEGIRSLYEGLLKALPLDINALPKEMRKELQDLLKTSLKTTGRSVREGLDSLMDRLPEGIKNRFSVEDLKSALVLSVEREGELPRLKGAMENTGVVLETKLKTMARMANQEGETGGLATKSMGEREIKDDLKAFLLKLRRSIEEGEGSFEKDILRHVNTLLKDIETFQFLSKVTDSFYSFLPLDWHGLKDGEIAFKKGKTDPEGTTSYFCRIALDLERFGRLVIMVLMHSPDFFLSFKSENAGFYSLLKSHVEELKDTFKARGLNLKSVNVMGMDDGPLERLEGLEYLERIVDVKV